MAVQPNPGAQSVTLNGSEIVDVLGLQWGTTTTGAIAALASLETTSRVVTTISTVGAGTLTAAAIVGGSIRRTGSQSSTPFTDTTATAALIIAALPAGAPVGADWTVQYINATNAVATIAGGSNVTINSGITPTTSVTVPANGYATFLASYSSATTVTFVQTDSGAYSADATDTTKVLGFSPSGQATATTAILASTNQANATYTLPPSTGVLAATSGANLDVVDIYRTSAPVTANATTTYANVTGLSGAVAIGTYRFRAVLPSTVASGTGGIKYAFNYTTAVLSAIEATGIGYTASAVAVQHTTTTTTQTDLFTQAAVVIMTILEGTFTVSTAGTVAVQVAQNTSNGSNTVALLGGSFELTRIA